MLIVLQEALSLLDQQNKKLRKLNALTRRSRRRYKRICGNLVKEIVKLMKTEDTSDFKTLAIPGKTGAVRCKVEPPNDYPAIEPAPPTCTDIVKYTAKVEPPTEPTTLFPQAKITEETEPKVMESTKDDETDDDGHTDGQIGYIEDDGEFKGLSTAIDSVNEIEDIEEMEFTVIDEISAEEDESSEENKQMEENITAPISQSVQIYKRRPVDEDNEEFIDVVGTDDNAQETNDIVQKNASGEGNNNKHGNIFESFKVAMENATSKNVRKKNKTSNLTKKKIAIKPKPPKPEIKVPVKVEKPSPQKLKIKVMGVKDKNVHPSEMLQVWDPINQKQEPDKKRRGRKKGVYQCRECLKFFENNVRLNSHMLTHSDVRPHACNVCGTRFKRLSNLRGHIQLHRDDKPYKCSECADTFKKPEYLVKHFRTHTGEKRFKCLECDRLFTQQANLQQHMFVHTGEKPFQCDICDKRMSTKFGIERHKLIHTGGKPYCCDICLMKFRHGNALKTHRFKKHGIIF